MKYISKEEQTIADGENITYHETPLNNLNQIAPHFALMVRDQLIKQYGEEYIGRSGFKVKTTIELEWQQFAEQTVKQQVSYLAGSKVSNGAAVALDPKNGAIRILVGSSDWSNDDFGKVNMATALRQPGSSFKPLVYAVAIENKVITPYIVKIFKLKGFIKQKKCYISPLNKIKLINYDSIEFVVQGKSILYFPY